MKVCFSLVKRLKCIGGEKKENMPPSGGIKVDHFAVSVYIHFLNFSRQGQGPGNSCLL